MYVDVPLWLAILDTFLAIWGVIVSFILMIPLEEVVRLKVCGPVRIVSKPDYVRVEMEQANNN